jgi:hypothetical protein
MGAIGRKDRDNDEQGSKGRYGWTVRDADQELDTNRRGCKAPRKGKGTGLSLGLEFVRIWVKDGTGGIDS